MTSTLAETVAPESATKTSAPLNAAIRASLEALYLAMRERVTARQPTAAAAAATKLAAGARPTRIAALTETTVVRKNFRNTRAQAVSSTLRRRRQRTISERYCTPGTPICRAPQTRVQLVGAYLSGWASRGTIGLLRRRHRAPPADGHDPEHHAVRQRSIDQREHPHLRPAREQRSRGLHVPHRSWRCSEQRFAGLSAPRCEQQLLVSID